MKKFMKAIYGTLVAATVIASPIAANAAVIDVGPLPLQNCPPKPDPERRVDCIRPSQDFTSYTNLDRVIWRGGSDMVVWICDVSSGYSPPTTLYSQRNGCGKKVINRYDKTMNNPGGPRDVVDVYIYNLAEYDYSYYDLCTTGCGPAY